jgi:hypothetical protein
MSVGTGNAALATVFATSAATLLATTPKRWREWLEPVRLALLMLFAAGLALAIEVGPHPMYYVPVPAIGAMIAGRLYASVRSTIPYWATAGTLVIGLILVEPMLAQYGRMAVIGTHVEEWTGVQVHESAARMARMRTNNGLAGDVATLYPTLVIDMNSVRREFAAGPFFFRSADLYPMDRVVALHGVGPATLETVFANAPPAAIVGGFDGFPFLWKPPMDSALIDYARRHGYRLVDAALTVNGYRNGQVWLRAK